jgi:hypothetical protein
VAADRGNRAFEPRAVRNSMVGSSMAPVVNSSSAPWNGNWNISMPRARPRPAATDWLANRSRTSSWTAWLLGSSCCSPRQTASASAISATRLESRMAAPALAPRPRARR